MYKKEKRLYGAICPSERVLNNKKKETIMSIEPFFFVNYSFIFTLLSIYVSEPVLVNFSV